MTVLLVAIITCCILFALYLLSVKGRTGHTGLQELRNWAYAHRGLHGEKTAENSLTAFRKAKEAGYGVELDVHLLADGNLAVIHDAALGRTTGREGFVEDLTTDDLKDYFLEGTADTIPQFCEVLDLFAGVAPIIVELKTVRNNYPELCKAACNMMDRYDGAYCMESFDPRCIRWLRKNRPDIIRGQLTEDYFASANVKVSGVLKFLLKHQMLNFLTRPDFVAYRYRDRKTLSNAVCRKLWRMQGVTWTLENKQDFDTAVKEGWIPIFEGFTP